MTEPFLLQLLDRARAREERLDLLLPKLESMAAEEAKELEKSMRVLEQIKRSLAAEHDTVTSDEEEDGDDSSVDFEQEDAEELALRQRLSQLQEYKQALLGQIAVQDAASELHSMKENDLIAEELSRSEEESLIRSLYQDAEHKIGLLTSRTALTELFTISTGDGGVYGTINGLKLGWIPASPNETLEVNVMEEINAALGFAALMLDSLARSIHFDFFFWRLDPKGSRSEMVNVKTPSQRLCLYLNTSGGTMVWNSTWWLWNTSFNAGVKAFATCVDELAEFLKLTDQAVMLPHKIDRGMVGGATLQFSLTSGAKWTKAMKYLLTDLKWLEIFCIRAARRARTHASSPRKSLSNVSSNGKEET